MKNNKKSYDTRVFGHFLKQDCRDVVHTLPLFSRFHEIYAGLRAEIFRTMRENYSFKDFKRDCVAGLTVAIIALPLSMALAIASGTTPDRGLFTAIVAGFLISFLGGSRFQIGGPTGAFVVVIYNIIAQYGYDGLAVATMMAGAMLMLAGFFKLGSLIKYIPYPVVTGFTAGIAVIIFSSQIKDLFGLQMESVPAEFIDKWIAFSKPLRRFAARRRAWRSPVWQSLCCCANTVRPTPDF